jgi:hypothetical protein
MQNIAAILDDILNEADALIRQRLKDRSLELPHLVLSSPSRRTERWSCAATSVPMFYSRSEKT